MDASRKRRLLNEEDVKRSEDEGLAEPLKQGVTWPRRRSSFPAQGVAQIELSKCHGGVGRRAERHHRLCRLGRDSKTKGNGKLIAREQRKKG